MLGVSKRIPVCKSGKMKRLKGHIEGANDKKFLVKEIFSC